MTHQVPEKNRATTDRQLESELERTFREIADHAPLMIWVSGVDKRCTWFNKPWLDFTGRTMEQESGDGWSEGIHPEDLHHCVQTYSGEFDARRSFKIEYRLRRYDGEWRHILDHGVPVYRDGQNFSGYMGSCIDVTEQKSAEAELRASQERMWAILNTAADSIITTDRQGIIVTLNGASESMFGYTESELLGRSIQSLIPLRLAEESNKTREAFGLRKDGSIFPVEFVTGEVPQLGLSTGIYRDISQRKKTEQQLAQYRKDLSAMSSELLLAEERERQRLAEDLHDGLGQALFRARLKVDQAIARGSHSLREVAGILEEIGKMVNSLTFQLSPPVLRQLGLRAAIIWLIRDIKQRYNLTVELIDDGRALQVDERTSLVLFRCLRELLINIAKHAETNSGKIFVRQIEGEVEFEIEDCGKGFDLAFQRQHVDSGQFGLFSIRERLNYLGGGFMLQSKPGVGTRVALRVPIHYVSSTA